jgi:hypothetical protein
VQSIENPSGKDGQKKDVVSGERVFQTVVAGDPFRFDV